MKSEQVYTNLQQLGIDLKIADDGSNLVVTAAPGQLTDALRILIRTHKQDLILLCCYRAVQYQAGELYNELPKCFQGLQDGAILALYRDPLELKEHVFRVAEAKEQFVNADNLIDVAVSLGGMVVPVQELEGEEPF